jgi:hypothetical protein
MVGRVGGLQGDRRPARRRSAARRAPRPRREADDRPVPPQAVDAVATPTGAGVVHQDRGPGPRPAGTGRRASAPCTATSAPSSRSRGHARRRRVRPVSRGPAQVAGGVAARLGAAATIRPRRRMGGRCVHLALANQSISPSRRWLSDPRCGCAHRSTQTRPWSTGHRRQAHARWPRPRRPRAWRPEPVWRRCRASPLARTPTSAPTGAAGHTRMPRRCGSAEPPIASASARIHRIAR